MNQFNFFNPYKIIKYEIKLNRNEIKYKFNNLYKKVNPLDMNIIIQ